MHGGDALQRQQVVHDREHPFLHLAAVPGAADQLNALGEVESDEVFRVQALLFPLRVGALRAVHHDEVGREFRQLFVARADEHVFNEVRLPGHFGNETYAETGIGVGAAESVDDKQAFTGQLLGHQPFQMLPGFLRKRLVVVFTFAFIGPPDGVAGGVVAHEILIFRRTTGKNARVDGDSTQSG